MKRTAGKSLRTRKAMEQAIHLIFLLCGIVAVGFVLCISVYLVISGLPAIREKLAAAVGTGSDLSRAIMKYFDDYTAGVHTHMAYEEEVVFPYVRALLEGRRQQDYSIDIFSRHHDQVETLLTEFKNILIKYYPSASTNEINNVLFDIFNCENDLASHNAVEDLLFVPAVGRLEKRVEEEG